VEKKSGKAADAAPPLLVEAPWPSPRKHSAGCVATPLILDDAEEAEVLGKVVKANATAAAAEEKSRGKAATSKGPAVAAPSADAVWKAAAAAAVAALPSIIGPTLRNAAKGSVSGLACLCLLLCLCLRLRLRLCACVCLCLCVRCVTRCASS
jgi:hypothetical protein